MSKITNIKQHIEDTKYLHNENVKELEKVRDKEIETFKKELDKLNKEFKKGVRSHFKGFKVKIEVDEFGLVIISNRIRVIEHNYNLSKFEGIDRETYKSIIALYEENWGEPKEQINTATSNGDTILTGINTYDRDKGISSNDLLGNYATNLGMTRSLYSYQNR